VPCSSRNLLPTFIGQFEPSLFIAFFLGEPKYLTVTNATWKPLAVFSFVLVIQLPLINSRQSLPTNCR